MKTTFDMTLFDDEQTRNKLPMLNTLEAMFDDERNILPPEYFYFSDDLPLGSRVRITFELVNDSVPVQTPALWQFRWTNPGDYPNVSEEELAWQEVKPVVSLQTLDQRIEELKQYQYNGKSCYVVRPLYVGAV